MLIQECYGPIEVSRGSCTVQRGFTAVLALYMLISEEI